MSQDRTAAAVCDICRMRVLTRHRPDEPEAFSEQARRALEVLAEQPGFLSGELGRSPDEPSWWIITTSWTDVGSMRRGLGSYAAKVALAPLLPSAIDEPSTFEVLFGIADSVVTRRRSDVD